MFRFLMALIFAFQLLLVNCTFAEDIKIDKIPPDSVVNDAKSMYIKIKKLSSMSNDLSYKDYNRQVAELSADYDMFSSEQRDYPQIVNTLGVPVKNLKDANEYWYNSIIGYKKQNLWGHDAVKAYRINQGRLMEESFQLADKSLKELDDFFYKLKKQKNSL